MWSWNLGRLFGIDISVHASFLLLLAFLVASYAGAGLLAVVLGLVGVVALFASVVAHELGHALTARAFGIGTRQILLLPIGGVAQLEQGHMRPRVELLVALAGPVVSFLLAGVFFTFGALFGDITPAGFFGLLAWSNLGLAVFNMIPAFPMDGGRVLRAALARRIGHERATSIAATIGTWAAVALGAFALVSGKFMLGLVAMFLWFSARSESRHVPPWRPFSGLGGLFGGNGRGDGMFGRRSSAARDAGPTRRPVTVLRDPGPPPAPSRDVFYTRGPGATLIRDRHGRTWLLHRGTDLN
jgi:stage IV sporulation protein FB